MSLITPKMMALPNAVFVFGSNLAGSHGKGAALTAKNVYGARSGCGVGRTGRCYALPTKGYKLEILKLEIIFGHIKVLMSHGRTYPNDPFFITRVGCGYAKYTDNDIAPLFEGSPSNFYFDPEWERFGLQTWDKALPQESSKDGSVTVTPEDSLKALQSPV